MIHKNIFTIFGFILAACAGPTLAQCTSEWLAGQGVPGIDGTIYTMTTWDPDGAGPRPERILIGGSFELAGNVPANNIAQYDPYTQRWFAFGSGTDGFVSALAVLDGKIYVGGYFTYAGGEYTNGLACLDPATHTWSAVGGGLGHLTTDPSCYVSALTEMNGKLYIAGYFATAGGVEAENICCWDPVSQTFSALGTGIAHDYYTDTTRSPVFSLAALDGKLYVGGEFYGAGGIGGVNNIACWDPATETWSALGDGVGGVDYACVYSMEPLDGKLYVGGDFATAGAVSTNHLAAWDPATSTWSAVMSQDFPIIDMTVADGILYVLHVSDLGELGSWDPATSTWTDITPGLDGATTYDAGALAAVGCELYVGGDFTNADGLNAKGIAKWDLLSLYWSALGEGIDDAVLAIAASDYGLYVGGKFTSIDGVAANGIARLYDGTWEAMGSGVDGEVQAITVVGGSVYVGGLFTNADGTTVNCIARWGRYPPTGIWHASGLQNGVDGPFPEVAAMAELDDKLYVGGSFTSAGNIGVNNIACWDLNTRAWSPMGTGTDVRVSALAALDGKLYLGGEFTMVDGEMIYGIACWDPATQTYSTLGNGLVSDAYPPLGATVSALAVLDGKLYVAGDFIGAGDVDAKNIACWDPATQTWSALGAGFDEDVYTLLGLNNKLYVGGLFERAGGVIANSIAVWTPLNQTWSPLGTGADDAVYALASRGNKLFVGGYFATTDDEASPYLAEWYDDCPLPTIISAVSYKTHGTLGEFGINVLDRGFDQDIESRTDGVTKLVVGFGMDIVQEYGNEQDVQLSSGTVSSATKSASNELTIEMSGTTNGVPLTVAFPGISLDPTNPSPCTETLCIRQLVGDVAPDQVITALDRVKIRDAMVTAVTVDNFRLDVVTDGIFTALDRVKVRDAMGTGIVESCP